MLLTITRETFLKQRLPRNYSKLFWALQTSALSMNALLISMNSLLFSMNSLVFPFNKMLQKGAPSKF